MSLSGRFAQACAVRLTLVPLAALLLLPVLPAAPAAAAGNVRVTAVVRDASGHLTIRERTATDLAHGRWLAGSWRSESNVVAADVDHRIHASSTPDPYGPRQWGLNTLRAADVGVATGQVVAVVDTGVDAAHPDLSGVVLPGADCQSGQPGAGCSGVGTTDPNGHGTHVAGIVAAVAGNGIGGAGLAQGAQILPVRAIAADGSGWDSDAAQGVIWAADHGATVINLSFGGPDASAIMDSAVSYALGKGVSIVVAAGNEAQAGNPVEWPAADPGVIAVGAVDSARLHAPWSNTGSHVALVAPGVQILSTLSSLAPAATIDPADPPGYATWDGTSMAAPFVAAAVALLRHAQPTLNVAAVRQRLMDTADDLGPAGVDPTYGAGLVDIVAAEADTAPITVAPPPAAVLSGRISASRTTAPYAGAVTIASRVLSDGQGTAGLPVRLQRQVGTSWIDTRSGTSGEGGLASWLLHPDRTMSYRVAGTGWTSPAVRVSITPVVTLRASTTGAAGRVLPSGSVPVRVDYRRGTAWVALTTVRSAVDGTFQLTRRLAAGTVLRAVVSGVASPAAKVA
jgi:subtilisin family serine protease